MQPRDQIQRNDDFSHDVRDVVGYHGDGRNHRSERGPDDNQITGANGTPYTVEGPILAKYQSLTDAQKKDLGATVRQRAKDQGR